MAFEIKSTKRQAVPTRDAAGRLSAPKIIYIDDDATNRAVIREMLSSVGLTMVEAGDALAGLKTINESCFQLVLMDLRMPGVNGVTAIRQLRAGEMGERSHVVVLTGELSDGIRALCTSAGADAFLEKPVRMGKLLDVVAAVSSHRCFV